jgi:ADP-ribose pyrophosphatase YjhB (NUDIX family)
MRHCIRAIAICIIRRGEDILVCEGNDSIKREVFYRPLGGGIEFGESGREAVAREFREEIGAQLCNIRFLGTLENIFTYQGQPRHEIVLIYEADLEDQSLYRMNEATGRQNDGAAFNVRWISLAYVRGGEVRLYPDGLLPLLETRDA